MKSIILSLIITLHLFFLGVIILAPPDFQIHKKRQKKLVVNTVCISKPLPVKPQAQAKGPVKKAVPQPKPVKKGSPKQNPVKKQPPIAEKKISKTLPARPRERAKISDSLIKELEESIAKIENNRDKETAKVQSRALPQLSLQIDCPSQDIASAEEGDYIDALIGYLHQCLTLPDYGEVKIQLNLRQDGTVAKVVVLKTQSEKNREYLEKHLSQLTFPVFNGAYENKKESVFTLTFCNE